MAIQLESLRKSLTSAKARWQAANTTFSNLSDAQQRALLGVVVDHAALARAMAPSAAASVANFAPAIDWRNRNGNHVTAIKDQLGCGSCVSFCTCAVVESMASIEKGAKLNLSEADQHFCSSHGANCEGWWPDWAYEQVQSRGVADEAEFPYPFACLPHPQCVVRPDRDLRTVKISRWGTLANTVDRKNYLSNTGPCSAVFHVFQDFGLYTSGVYHHVMGDDVGLHCVEVIGYSETEQCWLCKNSVGNGWGMSGFFKIAYGEAGIDSEFPFWTASGVILPNVQSNWRWCHKCQGLYFSGNATQGVCPAGSAHDHTGSGDYSLVQNTPSTSKSLQSKWRWCRKCQGLYFSGSATQGVCPGGMTHDSSGSGDYVLAQNLAANLPGQHNWRWCRKCQGLYFGGNVTQGVCQAGGTHDCTGSGDYNLLIAG